MEVSFFPYHVNSGDQIQAIRLGGGYSYLLLQAQLMVDSEWPHCAEEETWHAG